MSRKNAELLGPGFQPLSWAAHWLATPKGLSLPASVSSPGEWECTGLALHTGLTLRNCCDPEVGVTLSRPCSLFRDPPLSGAATRGTSRAHQGLSLVFLLLFGGPVPTKAPQPLSITPHGRDYNYCRLFIKVLKLGLR